MIDTSLISTQFNSDCLIVTIKGMNIISLSVMVRIPKDYLN